MIRDSIAKTLRFEPTLRLQVLVILSLAVFVGVICGVGWFKWKFDWEKYQAFAYESGVSLAEDFDNLRNGADVELRGSLSQFELSIVTPERINSNNNSVSLRFPDLDGRNYETGLSFIDFENSTEFAGTRIPIRIFSRKLKYSISTISGTEHAGLPARFGALVRTLTVYCGDTVMFVNIDQNNWMRVDGGAVWDCAAAPRDSRLLIFIVAGISLGSFLTLAMNAVDRFDTLSNEIRARASTGRITPIDISGPDELMRISDAVNDYFAREKHRLEQRANLLSGISHDLGTPATRLKLRAALIEDEELRQKFERDIDQITSMIEGVLAYTRNEMNVEEPRRISLLSLVQSVVDDYADIGLPVTFLPMDEQSLSSTGTIFKSGSTRSMASLSAQKRVLCSCRPNAIRRALSNLIDNAIKYGKSAAVSLHATSKTIEISVQDSGSSAAGFDFENMTDAFKRGANAGQTDGIGLGLTIVSNIALSHGGKLSFSSKPEGTRVTLILPR